MTAYRHMSNLDLITAESELDFRDPDIITEIFSRAEDFEPGISEQYVSAFWDHPRMRGENAAARIGRLFYVGSPPHARGKCPNVDQVVTRPGITPACAGKMSQARKCWSTQRDHPRMRGENLDPCFPPILQTGSPPHARGKYTNTRN